MGTDAEVFVFDYDAYITEVVPAFHKLLLTGHPPDWLYPIIKKRDIQFENLEKTDLLRHCTYLGYDFSWRGPYDGRDIYDLQWDQRSCKSEDCPERGHCPFHQYGSPAIAERLLWLFEVAVSIKCLGQSQFVGRSKTVVDYWGMLSDLGICQDNTILKLLALLGKRGFVIGYQWGFGYEGINGWLDPQETTDLAKRLGKLSLPRYETSFEAMESFRRHESGSYEYLGFSFEALSLSFVRTVAAIAARENKGLLWGNGVMPSQYYFNNFFSAPPSH